MKNKGWSSQGFPFQPFWNTRNWKLVMEGQREWGAEKWITSLTIWLLAVQKVTWHRRVRAASLCVLEVPNAIFKPRADFENIFLLLFCHTHSLACYVRASSATASQSLLFLQADLACTTQTLDPSFGTKVSSRASTKNILSLGQVLPPRWEMELLFLNCYSFIHETAF